MHVLFVGDSHGCVRHLIGAVWALQAHRNIQLDLIVQVGDFHAYAPGNYPVDDWFVANNPAELDAQDIATPGSSLERELDDVASRLDCPIHVITGNHEDFAWLAGTHSQQGELAKLDAHGVFTHVADGATVTLSETTIGYLGMIDAPGTRYDFNPGALEKLHELAPGSVDILVTHDNPRGYQDTQAGRETGGSDRLSALIDHLQPWLHVGGHIHQVFEQRIGATRSRTLNMLVPPASDRWTGETVNPQQHIADGALGLVDTNSRSFEFIEDAWLKHIPGDKLDLTLLAAELGV